MRHFWNYFLLIGFLFVAAIFAVGQPDNVQIESKNVVVAERVFPASVKFDRERLNLNALLRPMRFDLTFKDREQIKCLAQNLYFEARNQPLKGIVGVAFVTANRIGKKPFGHNYCGVIFQKGHGSCAFSWTCDGMKKDIREYNAWQQMNHIATNFYKYRKMVKDPTYGATYYHADYVWPHWNNVKRTIKIGDHIFYRKA